MPGLRSRRALSSLGDDGRRLPSVWTALRTHRRPLDRSDRHQHRRQFRHPVPLDDHRADRHHPRHPGSAPRGAQLRGGGVSYRSPSTRSARPCGPRSTSQCDRSNRTRSTGWRSDRQRQKRQAVGFPRYFFDPTPTPITKTVRSVDTYDLIIIGSGSGNSIPPFLADRKIAIVERGVFGGTCLNVGCIPSKMFVLPADVAESARHGHRLGVSTSFDSVDWPAIRDRFLDGSIPSPRVAVSTGPAGART